MILARQLAKLETEKEEFAAELAASSRQEHTTTNPKINAVNLLMEGVVISLGETTEKIKLEHQGPLSVIENSEYGGFRFPVLSPLQKMAGVVEEEILEAEAAEAAALAESAKVELAPPEAEE